MKSKQEELEKTMPAFKTRNWAISVKGWDYYDTTEWEEELINHTEQDGTKLVRYLSIGKHTGHKTGYQHCHLNLELERPKTMHFIKTKLFMRNDIHVEARKGTREQCDAYLTKDHYFREIANTRRLRPGHRTDLDDLYDMIEEGATLYDCYREHFGTTVRCYRGLREYIALRNTIQSTQTIFDPPEVIVYVGPSGSGKSWRCSTDPDYMAGGYRFSIQMDSKVYFDGYNNQKTIWFDEFSGRTLPFTTFCQLADRFAARYETKGGSVLISGLKKIIISTIQFPHLWWAGSERFNTDTEQLYRRITKCYYLGAPRITSTGRKQYAKPLEFNPRECGTGDFEAILRRNVEYEDPVEEDPDATEDEDSEATIDESD